MPVESRRAPAVARTQVRVVPKDTAATQPRALGVTPWADGSGASFGVWAPNAIKVELAGPFNGWNPIPLQKDDQGNHWADVQGVKVGDQYKYRLTRADGTQLWRNDPRAHQLTADGSPFVNSIIYDPTQFAWSTNNFKPVPLEQQIIYELHLGTFNAQSGPGNWESAIQKLDYLQQLGVTTVEVMPIHEFMGQQNWGYDVDSLFALERAYGTPADAQRFVDAAHARGMSVMVDWVPNHMSGDAGNLLLDFDGETYGKDGIYFYSDERNATGFGPRPDYGRPEVRQYLVDSIVTLLSDKAYRFDQVRVDSTITARVDGQGNPIPEGEQMLKECTQAIQALGPDKVTIAEDTTDNAWVTQPGGLGFRAQWDPNHSFNVLMPVLTSVSDEGRDMNAVVDFLLQSYNGDFSQRVIYVQNHDVAGHPDRGWVRLPAAIAPEDPTNIYARKRSLLGAGLILTARGIPLLFQGQEFLETKNFDFVNTPPLDWSKLGTFGGIFAAHRDLIHLRRNVGGVTAGLIGDGAPELQVNSDGKVVAALYKKNGGPGDDTLVVFNFSNQSFPVYDIGVPQGGSWKVRMNSDSKTYSPDFNDVGGDQASVEATSTPLNGQPFRAQVALGPYSFVVLSQDPTA